MAVHPVLFVIKGLITLDLERSVVVKGVFLKSCYIVSQGVDYPRVDVVVETEHLGQGVGVVVATYHD